MQYISCKYNSSANVGFIFPSVPRWELLSFFPSLLQTFSASSQVQTKPLGYTPMFWRNILSPNSALK
jgi:hypothetical protein